MYPAAGLLNEGRTRFRRTRFSEPVIVDPGLAAGLRRVHTALSRGTEPFEAESLLSWVSWYGGTDRRPRRRLARSARWPGR